MPRGGGHGGRLLPLAADVPDRDGPAAGDREHVIEVTADLQPLAGRLVGREQVEPRSIRQRRGQQTALQCLGDGRTVPEHAIHPDGDAEVLAELLGQAQVGDLEAALAGYPGQGERAVAGHAVGDRHTEQRGRAEQDEQRCARPGRRPESPASSAWATRTDVAAACTWAGAEPGCGSRVRTFLPSSCDGPSGGPITNWRRSTPARSMSTITQLAMSPASSRAQRCNVTASLNMLLSSSSLVTAVTMSIRRVMARTSPAASSPSCARARVALDGTDPPGAAETTSRRVPSCSVITSAARVAVDGPVRPEQPALHQPGLPCARGRGQLALDRGAGRQIHERRQRLAGRIPGRRADQVPGPAVRAPHRGIRLEHEQGHRRVGEHGPKQSSFRAERVPRSGPALRRRLRPAWPAPRRRRRARRRKRRAGLAGRRRASPRPGAAHRAAPSDRRGRRRSHSPRYLAAFLLTIVPGERHYPR